MLTRSDVLQLTIILTGCINGIDTLKCRNGISVGKVHSPTLSLSCQSKCIVSFINNNNNNNLHTMTYGCDLLNACGTGKHYCCCDVDDCNGVWFAKRCAEVNSSMRTYSFDCCGLLVVSAIAMFLPSL